MKCADVMLSNVPQKFHERRLMATKRQWQPREHPDDGKIIVETYDAQVRIRASFSLYRLPNDGAYCSLPWCSGLTASIIPLDVTIC